MKTLTKISCLMIVLPLCLFGQALADTKPGRPSAREVMMTVKLRELKTVLKLDDRDFERFKPIYVRYDGEISKIGSQRQKLIPKVDPDTVSAAVADQMLAAQIAVARALLNVQERYTDEFRKVLTPQQILRFFRTEKEIRRKALAEYRKRFPPKPRPQAKP